MALVIPHGETQYCTLGVGCLSGQMARENHRFGTHHTDQNVQRRSVAPANRRRLVVSIESDLGMLAELTHWYVWDVMKRVDDIAGRP